jgi:YfiH family protein
MSYLHANWPAPKSIAALTTTREQGQSQAPYACNNVGLHVGDKPEDVLQNRLYLKEDLNLPSEPLWLNQTHSNRCIVAGEENPEEADAAVSRDANVVLAIMTADCLPIVLCHRDGAERAAIHAGWRGLANGIIENTLAKMHSPREQLMAWIGPAICGQCYETGDDVRDAFQQRYPFTRNSFRQEGTRLFANLPQKAEQILNALGIHAVYQSQACTFESNKQFYSYRREAQTGRMVTLIWCKPILP